MVLRAAVVLVLLADLCWCQEDASRCPPDESRDYSEEELKTLALICLKQSFHLKKSFVKEWLLGASKGQRAEYQTFDGWYNNPWHPSLGSAESEFIRLLPSAYDGGVYRPVNRSKANPLVVSDLILRETKSCSGHNASSKTGKNVFMVFFGQFVAEEILDGRKTSCPPDYFNIPIPKDHYFSQAEVSTLPFIRSSYNKKSSLSSNNPRKQVNLATAWIDGSVVYGKTKSHADALRAFKKGLLKSDEDDSLYPASNNDFFSMFSPARDIYDNKIRRPNFKIGNHLGHENPFVLTMNLIFYRWHNHLAKSISEMHPDWKDDKCFFEARKWVVATLQNVIVYEWLPHYLGEKLPQYERYNPSIDSSVSNSFEAAAMRFGHTLVPAAVYVAKRTGPDNLQTSIIRLCDSFYDAQELVFVHSLEALTLGMCLQAAEQEDPNVVDDLRRFMHGPPEFTRRDLMALNIQRGRDHGLPGYGVAYKMFFPSEDFDASNFTWLTRERVDENILKDLYSSVDDIDLFVGGMLEAENGPGPVFKEIIQEQFVRLRDGDRFWFENQDNGIFSEEEIQRIRATTMHDIILTVTDLSPDDLQHEVFHLPDHLKDMHLTWVKSLEPYMCKEYLDGKEKTCFSLPSMKDLVSECDPSLSIPSCKEFTPQTYDYFSGSEATYILSFLFLFFYIVGCILTLFLLVHMRKKESQKMRKSFKQQRQIYSDQNTILVTEWIGPKDGTRDILILFIPDRKQISICLLNQQVLRSIDLKHLQSMDLHISTESHLHYVLVRIVREYDLVVKFENNDEKENFVEKLEAFLGKIGVGRRRFENNVPHLLKMVYTKANRQAQLEKFFRIVFAQAFSINQENMEAFDIDYNHAKEIVNIELTAYEFAEALSLRPDALFVQQMFALIDADGNGYISFREFLNVIVIFAKGSPDDKTKLMFDMYDIDHSGKLSRQEFSDMIRSLLELANQSLSKSQMDDLIASMFTSAGLQNRDAITFDDFSLLLADHREELGYVHLSFDIGTGYKTATPASRKSIAYRAEETILRAYSVVGEESLMPTKPKTCLRVETKPVLYEKDLTKQRVNLVIRFIENYQSHIFWISLYTLVLFGIFIERAYYYSVEAEHTGFRRVAGYGVTITRGAASAMIFAFSTILLTMCRNTITFLRETFLHKYIPFDAAISFHKFIAFWALFFTLFHIIGHAINFYHVGTQTVQDLMCYFPAFHLHLHNPPKISYWLYQTITGITGVLLVIFMSLIYVFAVQFARTHVFNAFWKTHNLYPILYILMVLHGLGHLVQEPIFYFFFLGPCILFTLDMLVSVNRKKIEISVVKAELLPSGVTHLEFKRPENFEYKSGQWVRIACVPLNKNEFHPFTLSSAPHEENLSLHIRAVGPWTTNLRKIYDPNNLQQHAYPKIYLDGPYGEGHQDWFRYDVSVLVGGGIGITPFASILKDIVFKSSLKQKIFCKKLYFIWVTRSQRQFEWMIDIIQEVEQNDKVGLVDVHIFITQFYQKFDLRTTMLYICERHFQRVCGKSLFTGLRSKTHFGRPDFQAFFNSLRQEHNDVSKIAVFSCGPPQMTRSVQLSCEELNKCEGAIFVHHYENF